MDKRKAERYDLDILVELTADESKEKETHRFRGLHTNNISSEGAFIATKNNDSNLRIKVAKEWTERYEVAGQDRPSIKPADINCNGCLSSGPIYLYCRECEIRKCGLKKGIENCKECSEYKCDMLKELQKHFF